MPHKIRIRQKLLRYEKVLGVYTQGYAGLLSGENDDVDKASRKALKLMPSAPLSQMLAAESAQTQGNTVRARELYMQLLEYKPTEFAAIKGLLTSARQRNDMEEAIYYAERGYRLRPNAPHVAAILLLLYKQGGRWQDAELFLEGYRKEHSGIFSRHATELDIKKELAMVHYMLGVQCVERGDQEKALELTEQSNKTYPAFIPAAFLASELALKMEHKRKATAIIERSWKHRPTIELGKRYLSIYEDDSEKKKLKRAKKLLALNDNFPESHAVVAIAAYKAGDTTQARNHLKLALSEMETSSLCNLMVDIERADPNSSEQNIHQWIERARHAHPDPTWNCKECGHAVSEWNIECDHCHAIDAIYWRKTAYGEKNSPANDSFVEASPRLVSEKR